MNPVGERAIFQKTAICFLSLSLSLPLFLLWYSRICSSLSEVLEVPLCSRVEPLCQLGVLSSVVNSLSGLFVVTLILTRRLSNHSCKFFSFCLDFGNITDHIEGLLMDVVVFSLSHSLETFNGLLKGDKFAFHTSENLRNCERLRHETLDLTCTCNSKFMFLRKLIHTKNSNNILEGLVILEDLLAFTSDVVVARTDDTGVHHTRCGIQRTYSRVDSELGNSTRKD